MKYHNNATHVKYRKKWLKSKQTKRQTNKRKR